jgi:hypothetical protein
MIKKKDEIKQTEEDQGICETISSTEYLGMGGDFKVNTFQQAILVFHVYMCKVPFTTTYF